MGIVFKHLKVKCFILFKMIFPGIILHNNEKCLIYHIILTINDWLHLHTESDYPRKVYYYTVKYKNLITLTYLAWTKSRRHRFGLFFFSIQFGKIITYQKQDTLKLPNGYFPIQKLYLNTKLINNWLSNINKSFMLNLW